MEPCVFANDASISGSGCTSIFISFDRSFKDELLAKLVLANATTEKADKEKFGANIQYDA